MSALLFVGSPAFNQNLKSKRVAARGSTRRPSGDSKTREQIGNCGNTRAAAVRSVFLLVWTPPSSPAGSEKKPADEREPIRSVHSTTPPTVRIARPAVRLAARPPAACSAVANCRQSLRSPECSWPLLRSDEKREGCRERCRRSRSVVHTPFSGVQKRNAFRPATLLPTCSNRWPTDRHRATRAARPVT